MYYVNYELTVNDFKTRKSLPIKKYVEEIKKKLGYNPFKEESNWLNDEEDMKKLSEKYPEKIFIIYGIGEGPGDVFKNYFYNGKIQREEISFNDFDINKLEN